MKQITKTFPLRVILVITTSRLLMAPRGEHDNGIGDLYEILGWMTNDSPFTHQLPRFIDECRPWLYRWFPELATASCNRAIASLDDWIASAPTCPDEGVKMWLAELKMFDPRLKDEYDVPRIPQDDHEYKDPYDEMVVMRGTDEGIVLVNPKGQTP